MEPSEDFQSSSECGGMRNQYSKQTSAIWWMCRIQEAIYYCQ